MISFARSQKSSATLNEGDTIHVKATVVKNEGSDTVMAHIGDAQVVVPREAILRVDPRLKVGDTVTAGALKGVIAYPHGEYYMVEWDELSAKHTGQPATAVHSAQLKKAS